MAERELVGSVVVTRYRVIEKVASGATADIYEAEHVSLGTHVALKVLANNDANSEVAGRFLREGKALGMFRHPNIVELLEVGRLDSGKLFLATELVRGQSIRQLIEQGALEPRRALTIVREILDALGHAHGMGIVHRGMRPENVMVGEDGAVKVLDFGVAKLALDTAAMMGENKLTRTGIAVLGDPRYSAPEVARGSGIDGRADLYSVGMMLKEMLAKSANASPQLQLVISDSTQTHLDKRYRTAAEMRDGVEAALASLDDAAAIDGGWSTPEPSADQSPRTRSPRPSGHLPGVTERPSVPDEPIAPAPSQPFVAPATKPEVPADPMFTASPQVPTAPTTHTGPWHGEANLTASEHSRPPGWTAEPKRKRKLADMIVFAKQHRYIVGGALGVIVLAIIIMIVAGGSASAKKSASGEDGRTILKRGRDELEAGHRADAVSLFERAILLDTSLAANPDIRHDLQAIVESKDAVAAVLALEVLASRVSPPGRDVIVATAATGKNGDVRRRAIAIAERDGFDSIIDRVASLSLDLTQAATCEDRRVVIGKLRATADKRAVAPLKKAKVYKCVERDATDAITELEAKP